jgi:hypothetical protein
VCQKHEQESTTPKQSRENASKKRKIGIPGACTSGIFCQSWSLSCTRTKPCPRNKHIRAWGGEAPDREGLSTSSTLPKQYRHVQERELLGWRGGEGRCFSPAEVSAASGGAGAAPGGAVAAPGGAGAAVICGAGRCCGGGGFRRCCSCSSRPSQSTDMRVDRLGLSVSDIGQKLGKSQAKRQETGVFQLNGRVNRGGRAGELVSSTNHDVGWTAGISPGRPRVCRHGFSHLECPVMASPSNYFHTYRSTNPVTKWWKPKV